MWAQAGEPCGLMSGRAGKWALCGGEASVSGEECDSVYG